MNSQSQSKLKNIGSNHKSQACPATWKHVLPLVLGLTFAAYPDAYAAINGSDDFNDNIKDTSKWAADITYGDGVLTEISQHLQYTCASPLIGDEDYSYRPWALNEATYDTDWEVILDVHNAVTPGNTNQVATIGIEIDSPDLANWVYLELYASALDRLPMRRGFHDALGTGDSELNYGDTLDLGAESGAVRIAYNSQTKVLSCFYDSGGSATAGYHWVLLASFGINGSGGADGNASWGMSGSQVLYVSIYGYDSNTSIASGQLYADNFFAATASDQPPVLTARTSGTSFELSWPRSAINYSLEQTTSFISNSWSAVTQSPILSNGVYSITVPLSGSSGFFRLAR